MAKRKRKKWSEIRRSRGPEAEARVAAGAQAILDASADDQVTAGLISQGIDDDRDHAAVDPKELYLVRLDQLEADLGRLRADLDLLCEALAHRSRDQEELRRDTDQGHDAEYEVN